MSASAQLVLRADTFIYTDSSFGFSGGWSDGLSGTLHFSGFPGQDAVLNWTGNGWKSDCDAAYCTGCSCGAGTHVSQGWPATSSAYAYFTNDGNLLEIDPNYVPNSHILWQTYTGGNYGGYLDLQDDGNMVVRSSSDSALWSLF
jgi:hypothetical protein